MLTIDSFSITFSLLLPNISKHVQSSMFDILVLIVNSFVKYSILDMFVISFPSHTVINFQHHILKIGDESLAQFDDFLY